MLKNSNISWKKAAICSKHWSSGRRENLEDLPDLVSSPEYVQKTQNLPRALDQGTTGPKAKRRLLVRTQKEQDLPDTKSLDPNTGCEVKQNNFESELVARLEEREKEITKLHCQIYELMQKQ